MSPFCRRHLAQEAPRPFARARQAQVARNHINSYLRREGRKPLQDAEPLEAVEHLETREALPAANAISDEEQALLWRALEQIPETYREPRPQRPQVFAGRVECA